VAIENARLFGQTRAALSEAQQTYNQSIARGWAARPQTSAGFRFDKGRITRLAVPQETAEWTTMPEMQEEGLGSQASVALPIKVRDQLIGMINIRSANASRRWSEDELAIARAAVERAGLALENARLLEEAQRRAAKEQKISEVTAKVSASINMRNVLQTAVEELGRAMPGSDVIIQFEQENEKA
jgi:GAF domain-containing protein